MMFDKVNYLDSISLYQQADNLEKIILSVNNFTLTKKKINPAQDIKNKLNALQTQMGVLKDSMDDSGGDSGGGNTEVMLDDQEVEFKEK